MGEGDFLNSTIDACVLSDSRPGRFIPRQAPRYPENRRQGATQSLSGQFWKENHLPLPEIEQLLSGRPTRSLATVPTEPFRLHTRYSSEKNVTD
jgi:hypothetical protein